MTFTKCRNSPVYRFTDNNRAYYSGYWKVWLYNKYIPSGADKIINAFTKKTPLSFEMGFITNIILPGNDILSGTARFVLWNILLRCVKRTSGWCWQLISSVNSFINWSCYSGVVFLVRMTSFNCICLTYHRVTHRVCLVTFLLSSRIWQCTHARLRKHIISREKKVTCRQKLRWRI